MSFAKAAEELHVTPAALSFQIKSLEDHLGHPLFIRLNRAVRLTEVGAALAPGATDAFQTLTSAWRNVRRMQDETTLNVTAGPAFTAKWLAPRLYDFARAHPEIDLRFSATLRIMDFNVDNIDVAIRFGYDDRDESGLWALHLAEEWATPVMTPEMAEKFSTPESLLDAPLLFDDSIAFLRPAMDWQMWFRAIGIDHNPTHGPRFSNSDHAVDAALAGVGVALGRRSIAIKDLHEGKLVAPFKVAIQSKARYRFLCRDGMQDKPQIAAFWDWMLAEIQKTASVHDGLEILPVEDIAPL